jgi:hypothetical protein
MADGKTVSVTDFRVCSGWRVCYSRVITDALTVMRRAHLVLSPAAEEWHPDPVGGGRRPDIVKV